MSYSCFEHPDLFHGPRKLSDPCSVCGRPFSYPLDHPPTEIDGYRVVPPPRGALGRGFYGASFLVEHPLLNNELVFKVVPVEMYKLRGKDFLEESRKHIDAAEGTQHLVPLIDVRGGEDGVAIDFGELTIRCHVSVLKYLDGRSLEQLLREPGSYSARGAAQIAIDLLRLLDELATREVRHNDLHAGNILIQRLEVNDRRAGEIDEEIRAVAIDLGSLGSADAANPETQRPSDVNRIGEFLRALSAGLLSDTQRASDSDYRLAQALEEVALQMTRPSVALRVVDFSEGIDLIREAALFADAPWRDPGTLKRFNAGYNAQLLGASFVPRLLIDPEGQWTERMASPGPQVITGMRGCGKTMLLKALDIHSRINRAQQSVDGGQHEAIEKLRSDDFVAFYESANRLLDGLGNSNQDVPLHKPVARLFFAYARDAVQALRHLQSIDPEIVDPLYPPRLAEVIRTHAIGVDIPTTITTVKLEQELHRILVSLAQGSSEIDVLADPGIAFPDLSRVISTASPLWTHSRVLFLLDDASTRNLAAQNIDDLCSRLLFKDEQCAFKIVTEQQALERLRSPALIEAIQIHRDIDLFDLGDEVNKRMNYRGKETGGRSFIAQILEARAHLYEQHPSLGGSPARPEDVLGRATLESIAKEIAAAGDPPASGDHSKRTRKTRESLSTVYHGLNALSAVCVGDIGDVLAIYDLILRKAGPNAALPIDKRIQTQAFREYCVRRLWNLNRRKSDLRPYAVSFARAAHDLLMASARGKGNKRIRQYTAIHIQIDPNKQGEEYNAILELIDAGIFVFEGGSYGPRLKAYGSNPKTEFILNYRKLLGLSHYIGLSDRDRFEFRGDTITQWLNTPDDSSTFTQRLGIPAAPESRVDADDAYTLDADLLRADAGEQLALSMPGQFGSSTDEDEATRLDEEFVAWSMPSVSKVEGACPERFAAIIGWGFEERALESARVLLERFSIDEVVLVEYPMAGRPEIEQLLIENDVRYRVQPASELDPASFMPSASPVIVDVTGLTKSLIFLLTRATLRRDDRVFIAHSGAPEHWPLNRELEPILAAHGDDVNLYAMLSEIEKLQTGDIGDYEFVRMLGTGADDDRRRLLAAGVSVKHMRLMALLDHREFDRLELLIPNSDTARSEVARQVAEEARRSADAAEVHRVDFDDPIVILDWLGRRYRRWYRHGGFDVELALSGSKMHAVAAGALSDAVKISQCWYVKPEGVDRDAYSRGYTQTDVFEILAPRSRAHIDELVATAINRSSGND